MTLSQNEIETYNQDGLVRPAFRFDDSVRLELQQLAEVTLAATVGQRPESINCPHIADWSDGVDAELSERWLRIAGDAAIVDRVCSVIGEDVILWGSQFFCKPATDGMEVPWHQDGDYWPIAPLSTTTVWLAIDDATPENGCMRYIPGSHREQKIYHHNVDDRPELVLNQVTDAASFDEALAADDELQAGEFSLHDVYLIHGSNPNRSSRRRAALVLRYMPATSLYDRNTTLGSGTAHYKTRFPERPIYLVSGNAGKNQDQLLRSHPCLDV